MNAKLILFLSCFAAVTLTTSAVSAAPQSGYGGRHFASMPARGGHTFTRSGTGTWSGQRWGGGTWSGRNWNGGYGHQEYAYGDRSGGGSSVAQLQRRLARASYYHGAISRTMGPERRRAIRAYEGRRNQRDYGITDRY